MSLKENRKIANYYGAMALTGTTKQKKWAEEIRSDVLKSDLLSDEQKADFLDTANFLQKAKFWINNRDLDKSHFTKENLTKEYIALSVLRDKHHEVLSRSSVTVGEKEKAKNEIREQLIINKFQFGALISFPNFNPFNHYGFFEK